MSNAPLRPDLGDFGSIVCFRALVVGVEQTLGLRAAMVALKGAGRKRGHDLIDSLGLAGAGKTLSLEEAAAGLDKALGPDGTRLCRVPKLERDGDTYRVFLADTICSAGEEKGSSRELSFTFGALHGAMEALYDVKLRGKQTGSILRGQDFDIMDLIER